MKNLLAFLPLLLLLAACNKEDRLIRKADCQPYTTVEPTLNAGTSIASGKIVDDCMQLIVNYSGCSANHPFELYWDGEFSTTDAGDVEMVLYQIKDGVVCDAYITDTLYFDLSALRQAGSDVHNITVTTGPSSSITLPFDN
jgi:hypothetical protein